MPGSVARTGSSARHLARFSRTERALHWAHATAFLGMLASGLVLVVPRLGELVARRPLVKDVHLLTAVGWLVAIAVIVLAGDRAGLRKTVRELDGFDRDDRRWLSLRSAPQGRFNAGQKLNAAFTASFALLFVVSGTLLWLGERDTRFRLGGTIVLHDTLTLASLVLLVGHLYLALIHPSTRHALRGMTVGDVRADWAHAHHAKWANEVDPPA